MVAPGPGNKYIAGWLTLRAGSEAAFDAAVGDYQTACRAEPECRFFEMIRSRENPQTVIVLECFESEEAHAIHLVRPHVGAFFEFLGRIALRGRFENVIAGKVTPDAIEF